VLSPAYLLWLRRRKVSKFQIPSFPIEFPTSETKLDEILGGNFFYEIRFQNFCFDFYFLRLLCFIKAVWLNIDRVITFIFIIEFGEASMTILCPLFRFAFSFFVWQTPKKRKLLKCRFNLYKDGCIHAEWQ
jgi:hypothetical protein